LVEHVGKFAVILKKQMQLQRLFYGTQKKQLPLDDELAYYLMKYRAFFKGNVSPKTL
jgi:hypothetical protein